MIWCLLFGDIYLSLENSISFSAFFLNALNVITLIIFFKWFVILSAILLPIKSPVPSAIF